jgi:hypothetical protein
LKKYRVTRKQYAQFTIGRLFISHLFNEYLSIEFLLASSGKDMLFVRSDTRRERVLVGSIA